MKSEEYIDIIQFIYAQWKATTRDLYINKAVLNAIRTENPAVGRTLDSLLESGKNSSATDIVLANHFEGFEEWIASLGEDSVQRLAREVLESFAAKGPIN